MNNLLFVCMLVMYLLFAYVHSFCIFLNYTINRVTQFLYLDDLKENLEMFYTKEN